MERDKRQTSESGMEVKGLDLQGTSNGQGYRGQQRTADMKLGKKSVILKGWIQQSCG